MQSWLPLPALQSDSVAAKALGLPPAELNTLALEVVWRDAEKLIRVSRYNTGEPFFGVSGGNRFDAPGVPAQFGVCYFGYTLSVALAESVLHDEMPSSGKFTIAQATLDERYVLRFQGQKLKLANLTGASLKRSGGHADLGGSIDYSITQQWSLAVHNHPSTFDGFIYMSRHLNTDKAVVLFDRAKLKIRILDASKLFEFKGFASAAKKLGIVGI